MRLGASFREWLSGSYWLLREPAEERALEVSFEARTPDLRLLVREKRWHLSGTIEAEGLAKGGVSGEIRLERWSEGCIAYRLRFRGDDGAAYEIVGAKEWTGMWPLGSLTLLAASLVDENGEELGRARLRFDVRADGLRWIRALRLRF